MIPVRAMLPFSNGYLGGTWQISGKKPTSTSSTWIERSAVPRSDCEKSRFGSFVENLEQGPGSAGRAALALLPVADRFKGHTDAACKLLLRQAQALAHPPSVFRHIPHCFSIILLLLQGNVLFGRAIQNVVVNSSCGEAPRILWVDSDARRAHTPVSPFCWLCGLR